MDQYINKLFHVCITVPDIEEALKFYRDVLGLQSIGSLRHEKSDGKLLGLPGERIEIHANHLCGKITDNPTVIDLVEFVKPKTIVAGGPYKQMTHVGITRIAFDVDNVDEIYEKLLERGDIEIICEPMELNAPGGGWFKVVMFRDPFGIGLELIETHRPAGKKK